MTDYLALAMEQGEESFAMMAEEMSTEAEDLSGDSLMPKNPPKPQESPEGGFRFPPSGLPLETTKEEGLRPLPLETHPGDRPTEGWESRPTALRSSRAAPGGPAATSKPTKFGRIDGSSIGEMEITEGLRQIQGAFGPNIKALGSRGPQAPGGSWRVREAILDIKNGLPGSPLSLPGEEAPPVRPLLRRLRQAQWGAGFVQGQRRQLAVTLPETASAPAAWTAEDFDRACERDARRYGGGFGLY